ncbi:MAG: hypothetical protein GEU26_16735 [Nitrososphaeraceae archaeon]|nr:hypothetical protein [Nitrososphaeraceae archaeon]
MIDYLHEKNEDLNDANDASIPKEEKQYRELLRLTIGELKTSSSKDQGVTDNMYWSTDDNLRKLLRYRPSVEDMKLILRPMSYLSEPKGLSNYEVDEDGITLERRKYFVTLQQQLIKYFLDKYSSMNSRTKSKNQTN